MPRLWSIRKGSTSSWINGSEAENVEEELQKFNRQPKGVKKITVYAHRLQTQSEQTLLSFPPFDSLSPEIIPEITEMRSA